MSAVRFAVVTTAALGISSALNFLALIVWVRLLSPHEFGVLALASASALLLHALFFEWLRLLAARTLFDPSSAGGIDGARASALFRAAMLMTGLLVAATGGLLLTALAIGTPLPEWLPVVVPFAISEMVMAMVLVVSRLRLQGRQFLQAMVARSAIALLLGVVGVSVFEMQAMGVLLAIVAAQAGTALVIIVRDPCWRSLRLRSEADAAATREVFRLGAPLIVSTALIYLATIADRFIIDAVLGAAAVGQYVATADLLHKTLGFLFLAINISAYPLLVRAYESRGAAAAGRLLQENFAVQLAVGLPATLAFIMLAPGLASLFLGPSFRVEGERLLPWLAPAMLLRLLVSYHLAVAFQLTRRMTAMLAPPLVTLAVLVPCGIAATQRFGALGMALASLAAAAASYGLCLVVARRLMPVPLLSPDVLKVIAAGVALGAALAPFSQVREPGAVLAACAFGGLIYIGLLLVLRLEPLRPLLASAEARFRRS